jgi:Fur family ferric uptake transcriptional regulator
MTQQRHVILDELKRLDSHPTADELYEIVRKKLPKISLGTIYRNLEILAESGMIQKIEVGGTQKRFDGNTEDHYHIRCVECGRIVDIPAKSIPSLEEVFSTVTDFEIVGHRLELLGRCADCRR